MTSPNFARAFKTLIGHEGGYVNDAQDPGGETKFGICKRSYPRLDIKRLTVGQAAAIYKADFWDPCRGDHLEYLIAFNLFDGAVNSGVRQSVRWMQAAAGVADDGVIGPITMRAFGQADPAGLVARYNGLRLDFMADLKNWPAHGRGWARRVAANLIATPI